MSTTDPSPPKLAIAPKAWEKGLGPYYIGLFLWVVYFDQLGLRALPVGGIGWSLMGVLVGGLLCYLLLFRVPALWGQATGKPLTELTASTFGEAGARWVPGLLLGLAEVVWFAVAVSYATDLTLRGLIEVKFLDERAIRPFAFGALRLKGPVSLATSLAWTVAIGMAGRYVTRLVAAIMYVFPIFPAMLLGGGMLAMLGGLRWFVPTGIDPVTQCLIPPDRAGLWTMLVVVQLALGFFAMAGVLGADWGAASATERDVRVGGWVAAGLAPVVVATLALLAVAGHLGRQAAPPPGMEAVSDTVPDPFKDPTAYRKRARAMAAGGDIRTIEVRPAEATWRDLMVRGVGDKVGSAMLIVFGIMSLGPAVFSSFIMGHRFQAAIPRLSRTRWTLAAIALSWPLTATGSVDRLEPVFTLMGALFAPIAGCLTAEYARHKGVWPGPRLGLNRPGLLGWGVGLAVGLLPAIGGRLANFRPAAFWAFLVAFGAYRLIAAVAGEAPKAERAAETDPARAVEIPSEAGPAPNTEGVREPA